MTTATAVQSAAVASRIILVGRAEIAERLGVTIKAIERYQADPAFSFPKPEWKLKQGGVWRWTTIRDWSKRTGYPRPMFNRSEEP